jgi:methyl-accepting chemotaxis protein
MKISRQLSLGLIVQIFLLVLLTFSVFYQNNKLNRVKLFTVGRIEQIKNVNHFTLLARDYVNEVITFEKLDSAYTVIKNEKFEKEATETINQIWDKLQVYHRLKDENIKIENQAMEFSENTLEMMNKEMMNIQQMSLLSSEINNLDKVLDKNLTQESISTIDANLAFVNKSVTITLVVVFLIAALLAFLNIKISKAVKTIVVSINKNLQHLAAGDLTIRTDEGLEDRRDEVGELTRSINSLITSLQKIIGEIRAGSDSLAGASKQISASAQQMSQGSNQQASSVEEISATLEQISANIKQNAENSQTTEKISRKAQEGMKDVSVRALKLLDATREITEKIQIINDIAFQTNILALNAAVEAARAGEHGKGFAVVASEVRKLAERSKLAADQIISLAKTGFDLSDQSGKQIQETLPEIDRTNQLVQEISSASMEQDNGVNQVNSAIQQLNNVTQQNAAASEELATSSEELSSQADYLREIVAFFKMNSQQISEVPKSIATKVSSNKSKGSKPLTTGIQFRGSGTDDADFERF